MSIVPLRRVLFVGAFPPPGSHIFGGVLTSCRILMQSSFRERLDLDLVDSTQISNPPPPFAVRLLLAAKRFLLFIFRFERRKPDAVLLFTGIGASVVEKGAMGWYSRLRGCPAFIFPRGGGLLRIYEARGKVPLWIRASFGSADKILCQGPAWQLFAVRGLGLPPSRAPIIPNWTATPQLLAIGAGRRLKASFGPPRLLFVGWVEREKGVLELLEALEGLLGEGVAAFLDIVGHGHAFREANDFAEARGLRAAVTFSGWKEGPALEEKFRNADVFVLPSWEEGLPNAMIEAMAAGVCVVTTAVGTIPDVIRSGENGLLVPAKDAAALHQALRSVLTDAGLRGRLAVEGHKTARDNFSVEPAVDALIRGMFEKVVN